MSAAFGLVMRKLGCEIPNYLWSCLLGSKENLVFHFSFRDCNE